MREQLYKQLNNAKIKVSKENYDTITRLQETFDLNSNELQIDLGCYTADWEEFINDIVDIAESNEYESFNDIRKPKKAIAGYVPKINALIDNDQLSLLLENLEVELILNK